MSRNEQSQLPGLPINPPVGTDYPNQASSQSLGYSSDSSMNPRNLPILDTFYRYLPPDSGCGVSMCNPNIYRDPFPAPRGVQYAPPPPGVQYAPALPGTPMMTICDAPQKIPLRTSPAGTSISLAKLPLIAPITEASGSLAAVTTMAARQRRAQSPGNNLEYRFKRVKVTYSEEAASRRLRLGNLDARVGKGEVEGMFRHYAIDSVDIFHDDGGVYALVVLSNTADVREAVYKLWDKEIGGRRIRIELDSKSEIGRESQRDLEPARVLRSQTWKRGMQPPPKPASISSTFNLPPHLFHRPRPDANTIARDNDVRPELKAIAENRRMYIRDLPFGTTEEILRELLKERSIENLTIPYDPRTRLQTGYFAFVDFTTPMEVPKALKTVFHYSLAGNKIQGSTKPVPPMLREPDPCTHKVSGANGRLKITNIANGARELDLRTLFDGLSTNTIIIQKYVNSERTTGCAFVQFEEIIDFHRAAMRLSGRKTATLGHKCIGEASTDYRSLNKDEHERCGIDPQSPSGTEYGRDGKTPQPRPKAEFPSLPEKLGEGLQLDPVSHRPAPIVLPSLSEVPGDVTLLDLVPHWPALSVPPSLSKRPEHAMQLDPVPFRPAPSVQPSLPRKQGETPKLIPEPRLFVPTVHPSLPRVQGEALGEDQDANIFNRTALRDWFWEHKGLSLDI